MLSIGRVERWNIHYFFPVLVPLRSIHITLNHEKIFSRGWIQNNKDSGSNTLYLQESKWSFQKEKLRAVDILHHFPSLSICWNTKLSLLNLHKTFISIGYSQQERWTGDKKKCFFSTDLLPSKLTADSLMSSVYCAKADVTDWTYPPKFDMMRLWPPMWWYEKVGSLGGG